MDKTVASLLSLCRKAGGLSTGENACELALRSEQARLIIISSDASDNTKKKFVNKAFYYKVPVAIYGSKEELGRVTGGGVKSSVAVCEVGFSSKIKMVIENLKEGSVIIENNSDA